VAKDLAPIVGGNIKLARAGKELTQRQLASKVNGVDALAVSRWERGVSMPRPENLMALAEALDREVAWFYSEPSEAVTR
jgi:transcriptional regulator with XRE-family HTH domain